MSSMSSTDQDITNDTTFRYYIIMCIHTYTYSVCVSRTHSKNGSIGWRVIFRVFLGDLFAFLVKLYLGYTPSNVYILSFKISKKCMYFVFIEWINANCVVLFDQWVFKDWKVIIWVELFPGNRCCSYNIRIKRVKCTFT